VDISVLQQGDFVVVLCANCEKEPAIALCSAINGETIDIIWYEGTYASTWKPWKIRDPNNRRKLINWTDKIPKSSIILFSLNLQKKII
jgi:hypothetical protein